MKVSKFKELTNIEDWKELIVRQKESGLSISAWCRQNNMTMQQYYYRLRKVREAVVETFENKSSTLVKYTPGNIVSSSTNLHEGGEKEERIVVKYRDVMAEFSTAADIHMIAELMKELSK